MAFSLHMAIICIVSGLVRHTQTSKLIYIRVCLPDLYYQLHRVRSQHCKNFDDIEWHDRRSWATQQLCESLQLSRWKLPTSVTSVFCEPIYIAQTWHAGH